MKIMHHHAIGRFDLLISEYQIDNASRVTISISSEIRKIYVSPLCHTTQLNVFVYRKSHPLVNKDREALLAFTYSISF